MTSEEVLFVLNQHKEHYRVLPPLAKKALFDLIEALEEIQVKPEPVKPKAGKANDVGIRTVKNKKTSSRSKR